jgi:hypothetical protein
MEVMIDLSPRQMARAFFSMTSEPQAEFFEELALAVEEYSKAEKYDELETISMYLGEQITERGANLLKVFSRYCDLYRTKAPGGRL